MNSKTKRINKSFFTSVIIALVAALTVVLTALGVSNGIKANAAESETKTISLQLKCGGSLVGACFFTGTETKTVTGGGGLSVTTYSFNLTCDVSTYIEKNYTNFQIMPTTVITDSHSQNGAMWNFYINNNIIGFHSVSTVCPNSVSDMHNVLTSNSAYVSCDLIRQEVELPADPEKEGYTFAGWYYGTEAQHSNNCTAYNGEAIYEDTDLHAHWTINKFTVTYNSNGGSEVENKTVDWNTSVTLPAVERVGYNFKGWFLPDGTKYTNQPIKAPTTLTAQWEIKTFKVTFYANGEKLDEKVVEFGTTLTSAAAQVGVQHAAMRAYYNGDNTKFARDYVITANEIVDVKEMTASEKVAVKLSKYMWAVWTGVGLLGALIIISAIAITVAVKRR